MHDEELEQFKRTINLAELATSYGYSLVRKESCATCLVMRHSAEASKIVIGTGKDGHGIFFEVHGDAEPGSVIDFVKYRERCNLGQARVKLREYVGQPRLDLKVALPKPQPTTRDRIGNFARWQEAEPYSGGYLESMGLSNQTINAFADHIRMMPTPDGKHKNVAFRHGDEYGVSGWELKNKGFAGFSSGGGKALFACQMGETGAPSRIVITEAAIDAMSYYQLSQKQGLYVSFAGGLSEEQKGMLRKLLTDNPQAKVITATDADHSGEQFAVFIHSIRQDAIRARPGLRSMLGVKYKDWNDVLQNRPMQPQPAAQSPPATIPQHDKHVGLSPCVTPINYSHAVVPSKT